jgi:hypothetical protein
VSFVAIPDTDFTGETLPATSVAVAVADTAPWPNVAAETPVIAVGDDAPRAADPAAEPDVPVSVSATESVAELLALAVQPTEKFRLLTFVLLMKDPVPVALKPLVNVIAVGASGAVVSTVTDRALEGAEVFAPTVAVAVTECDPAASVVVMLQDVAPAPSV